MKITQKELLPAKLLAKLKVCQLAIKAKELDISEVGKKPQLIDRIARKQIKKELNLYRSICGKGN